MERVQHLKNLTRWTFTGRDSIIPGVGVGACVWRGRLHAGIAAGVRRQLDHTTTTHCHTTRTTTHHAPHSTRPRGAPSHRFLFRAPRHRRDVEDSSPRSAVTRKTLSGKLRGRREPQSSEVAGWRLAHWLFHTVLGGN